MQYNVGIGLGHVYSLGFHSCLSCIHSLHCSCKPVFPAAHLKLPLLSADSTTARISDTVFPSAPPIRSLNALETGDFLSLHREEGEEDVCHYPPPLSQGEESSEHTGTDSRQLTVGVTLL